MPKDFISDAEMAGISPDFIPDNEVPKIDSSPDFISDTEMVSVSKKRPSLFKFFKQGWKQSTPMMVKDLVQGKMYDPSRDVEPEGILENVAQGVGEYGVDVPLALATMGVTGLTTKIGATAARELAKEYVKKEGLKVGLRKALPSLATKVGLEGAAVGGIGELIHNPLKQQVTTGTIDPLEVAKGVAINTAAGAVLDPLVETGVLSAGRGLSKGFGKIFKKDPETTITPEIEQEIEKSTRLKAEQAGEYAKLGRELNETRSKYKNAFSEKIKATKLLQKATDDKVKQLDLDTRSEKEKTFGHLIDVQKEHDTEINKLVNESNKNKPKIVAQVLSNADAVKKEKARILRETKKSLKEEITKSVENMPQVKVLDDYKGTMSKEDVTWAAESMNPKGASKLYIPKKKDIKPETYRDLIKSYGGISKFTPDELSEIKRAGLKPQDFKVKKTGIRIGKESGHGFDTMAQELKWSDIINPDVPDSKIHEWLLNKAIKNDFTEKGILTKVNKDVVDPYSVVEEYGFRNAKEMFDSIAKTPNKKKLINIRLKEELARKGADIEQQAKESLVAKTIAKEDERVAKQKAFSVKKLEEKIKARKEAEVRREIRNTQVSGKIKERKIEAIAKAETVFSVKNPNAVKLAKIHKDLPAKFSKINKDVLETRLKMKEIIAKLRTMDGGLAKEFEDIADKLPSDLMDKIKIATVDKLKDLPEAVRVKGLAGIERDLKSEAQVEALRKKLYRDEMSKHGVYQTKEIIKDGKIAASVNKLVIKPMWKLLNATEVFNKIEENTAIPVGHIVTKASELQNKGIHFKLDQLDKLAKYKEKFKGYSAEFLSDLAETPIEKIKDPKLISIKHDIMDIWEDLLLKYEEASGNKIDRVKDYLPRRTIRGFADRESSNVKLTGLKNIDFAQEFERTSLAPSQFHSRNFWDLAERYSDEIVRAKFNKEVLPQVSSAVSKLRILGLDQYGEYIERTIADGMGIGRDVVNKMFKEDFVGKSREYINMVNEALKASKKNLPKTFVNTLTDQMYKSFLFLSPKTLIGQGLQSRLNGMAEVGLHWIEEGSKQKKNYTKLLDEVMPELVTDSARYLETVDQINVVTNPALKKVLSIVNLPSKPGEWVFNRLEEVQRKNSFLAGYLKAKSKGVGDDVLETLLPGQKRWVREGADLEEQAKRFGKLVSHRVNFLYSVFDKPEILRSGLGKYIPFTTWSRNTINRLYGDLVQNTGNSGDLLIRRLAMPTAYLMGIEALTGYSIPGANPASSVVGLGNMSPVPAMLDPIKLASQGKFKKAYEKTGSLIPMINLWNKYQKVEHPTSFQRKQRNGKFGRAMGLERSKLFKR